MSIKIKQLESGLALLQWLEGLGDLGSVIYVKDGKLIITLPIEGTITEDSSTFEDMATKAWVTEILEAFADKIPDKIATLDDIPIVKVVPLQLAGADIATVTVDDKAVTLRCDLSALATIISPTFLGFPTAPEPSSLSDDTSLATTAFVKKVLRLVTGIDVNKAIRDNVADLIAELLERYNKLQGTNTVLETTIQQLLAKVSNPSSDHGEIQTLILKVQQLIAQQETAENMPISAAQQLAVKLRNTDPLEGVNLSDLVELLLRYAATGSQDTTVNTLISTMLQQDVTVNACNDLKNAINSYLTNLFSQRQGTRKDIEDYLDSSQDIMAVIQRLLTVYKGLPSSTPAINQAVKDLTDALIDNATNEELREKASILEELLRRYNYNSYGLTDDDKNLEASLRELEARLAAIYDRIATVADDSDYQEFLTLLQVYSTNGKTSAEILLLLERLATALEKTKTGDTDPTLPTTILQTINLLTPLLRDGNGFSVNDIIALLLDYRRNSGNDTTVNGLLNTLATFLKDGDNNNGAATDKTAVDLLRELERALSDIKTAKETLEREQQEEIDKKSNSSNEDDIIKDIKMLSAAINNDPNFYQTIMSLINGKVDKTGDIITGDLSVTGNLSVTGDVIGDLTGNVTGTATSAVTDVNGKKLVDYVSDVTVSDTTLTVTKGNGDNTPYQLPKGTEPVTYQPVTADKDGLMRKEDYVKLQNLQSGIGDYVLPKATDTVLGGVMTGDNITNDDGKISVTKANIVSALGYTPANNMITVTYNASEVKRALGDYVKTVTLSGQTLTVTNGNDTATTFTTKDTTYNIFTGAGSTKAGTTGIIPAPAKGYQNRYLKGDGTWSKISASDIDGYTGSTSSGTGSTDLSDYLKEDTAATTYAPISSPTLKGTPKSVTPTSTDNSTAIATTAFVQTLLAQKQPLHAALTSISGLTTAADKMIYTTASNKYAVTTLTSTARTLLSKASVADIRSYLGVMSSSGTAPTATKLATARTIRTNLASTTAVSFDGSANVTPGVQGTLPVGNGGTGLTAAPSLLVNLASTAATGLFVASPRPGVTGTLPVGNGGTGQTNLSSVTVGKANQLSSARTISLTGGVTGSVSFDGSKDVAISTSVSAKEKSPAYGICNTGVSVAAKTVTIPDFNLVEGVRISVNFKNGNSAQSPTLNVNNTGAKVMTLAPGDTPAKEMFTPDITGISSIVANRVVDLTYLSGQWVVSRSNIWTHPLISGILSNAYWGGLVTTCYGEAVPGEGNIYYGICTTAIGTKAKIVTCPEMTSAPVNGTTIIVHMRNGNTHATPTFNVNSKGAKDISGPATTIKKIPRQSNIYLVYVDTSTSSTSSGRWHLGNISYKSLTGGDIYYVNTAAGTAAKQNDIVLPRERTFVHTNGGKINVYFANTNTKDNPTLSINGYGAQPMFWSDGARITKNELTSGLWQFVFSANKDPKGFIATRPKPVTVTSVDSATTATKLATARTISLTGKVTGNVTFDGSKDVSIATAIAGASISSGSAPAGTNIKKGYVNLGDSFGGLKLQWTTVDFIGSNKYVDCTFPTAFTSACYSVMICSGDNSTSDATAIWNTNHYTFMSSSITKTGVRIGRISSQANASYGSDWICVWAIGV